MGTTAGRSRHVQRKEDGLHFGKSIKQELQFIDSTHLSCGGKNSILLLERQNIEKTVRVFNKRQKTGERLQQIVENMNSKHTDDALDASRLQRKGFKCRRRPPGAALG